MTGRTIGEAAITRIEEQIIHEPLAAFPDSRPEQIEPHLGWLAPHCYDRASGDFLASIHSWLVRTKHHTILIDTCAGNDKQRPLSPRFQGLKTPYLERLAAAGVQPEQVDYVLCTHLHIDHVGWNTRLRDGHWVPTFPNAKYVFTRAERDHWSPHSSDRPPGVQVIYQDSVLPVIEAGQDLVVTGDEALDDEFFLMSTPGHTPGQYAVRLRSQGQEGLFTGDVMHNPIQVYYPDWNSRYCDDAAQSRATRRRVLDYCAENGCLVLPAHFGAPHAGRVRKHGDGFTFHFEPA